MEDISRLRNIAIVGTHHSGKTTLVEAMLATCGAISRRGSVADGTTTTDFEPECIGHAQSTCVGFAHAACGDVDLTIIDCPGFVDFFEESKIALLAADAAIVVIEADPSRIAQTQSLVDFIEAQKLPHLFFINKMDRPGADFFGTLAALQQAYGMHVVAEQMPIGEGETFRGFVDLAENAAFLCEGTEHKKAAIPADLQATVAEQRTKLLEALGDFDDHLLEELLEGVEPPLDEVRKDLCTTSTRTIRSFRSSSAPAVARDRLQRADRGDRRAVSLAARVERAMTPHGRPVAADPKGPVVAQVCKTIDPPAVGKLSVVRIFSGTLTGDTLLTDTSRAGVQSRPGGIYRLQGKKQEPVKSAGPGEIVALARLEGVRPSTPSRSGGTSVVMPALELPRSPSSRVAIRPKERLDEAKLSQMLARLIDEDPALRLDARRVHQRTAAAAAAAKSTSRSPPSGSRASTTSRVETANRRNRLSRDDHARHRSRTRATSTRPAATASSARCGCASSRASAATASPSTRRSSAASFPRQFFPAVEKGVREALMRGPIAAFRSSTCTSRSTTARIHAVDSSEASFKTAASMAIRDALPKCGAGVLEPIVAIEVLVPNRTPRRPSRSSPPSAASCNRSARPSVRRTTGRGARPASRTRPLHHRTAHRHPRPRHVPRRHERFEVVPEKVAQSIKEPALA